MKTWRCAFRKTHISSMFNRAMEKLMTAPVGSLSLNLFGTREEVSIVASRYTKGNRLALTLVSEDGSPWGNLTVNLPDAPLADDEILVKTWSENAFYREPALNSGLFVDTGRRVPTGMALAEVWRYTGKLPAEH